MPKFRVKGCFKENAEDVEIILEATSYKHAEKAANEKGILVSDVLVAVDSSVIDSGTHVLSSTSSESKPKSVEDQNNGLLPHRGEIILNLGILATLCACFPAGVGAWIYANKDIKLMKCNKMDSDGLFKTRAGKVLGILSVIMFCVAFIVSANETYTEANRTVAEKLLDEGVVGRWRHDIGHGLKFRYELENHGGGEYSMMIEFGEKLSTSEVFDYVWVEKEELSHGVRFTTIGTRPTPYNINGSIKSFTIDNEGNLSGDISGVKY